MANRRRYIVDELVSQVRQLLDENNVESIDDDLDILPALNRAQDVAANILARHYESPLIATKEVQLIAGEQEYDLPEDALEERLEKVEVKINGQFYEVPRINYRDVTEFDYPTTQSVPYYHAVIGDTFRVYPTPSGSYSLRIWYSKDPEPMVKQQGRIVGVNVASNYVTLNTISSTSELTTDVTELDAYVNLVDGQSGTIKATLQVSEIDPDCNRVTFKTTPDRLSVLNRTVVGAIPTDVAEDDYICLVHGSCVPFMKKPNTNFIIQHAVSDIKINKLGEPGDILLRLTEKLEQQVERSWVSRETILRVKKVNRAWNSTKRRYFGRQ
jgi:hypothetical protein